MGSDRSVLDQRTRRWICEACADRPATVPEIVEQLQRRGWAGAGGGALWSTVLALEQNGYLRQVGMQTQGRRKPSQRYQLVPSRREELRAAALRHAAHHVDAGNVLVLVPAGGVGDAVAVLRTTGPEVRWAMRSADSAVGLVVVLDGDAPAGVLDALLGALQRCGAERIATTHVLDRAQLNDYCDTLLAGRAATLPA